MTLFAARPAHANGVPIRLQLTYLAGLSNWGPPEARGDAELSFAEAVVRLDVRGLPALRSESYQLWLVKSGTNKATAIGSFAGSPDGVAGYTGKLAGLDGYDYDLLLITVEPVPDADPAPSNKRSIGGFFTPIKKADSAAPISTDVQPAELPKTGDDPVIQPGSPRHTAGMALIAVGGLALVVAYKRSRRSAP